MLLKQSKSRWRHRLSWGTAFLCLAVPHLSMGAANLETQQTLDKLQEASLTVLAASICAGTYDNGSEKSTENRYLADYGWDTQYYAFQDGKAQVHFTLARHRGLVQGKPLAVLAFRGSQTQGDWQLNLKTDQVPFPGGKPEEPETKNAPAVHQGFLQYARAALDCPVDLDGDGTPDNIPAYLKTHPDQQLLLTGHSLGGAGAVLYGAELVQQGASPSQLPIITFGAPAVGNPAFAKTYGSRLDLLRIYTSLDPVPGLVQTFCGGYQQFGREKEYRLSGNYTDYQHPISYYLDLAVRDYHQVRKEALDEGLIQPLPKRSLKGNGPIVALAVFCRDNGADTRFSPDLSQFLLDEYRSLLPRYVVIASEHTREAGEEIPAQDLRGKALAAGAQYLIVVHGERQRLGQTDKWAISLGQEVVDLKNGGVLSLTTGSTRVRFEQGILQSTLRLLENQKIALRQLLPVNSQQTVNEIE